MANTGATPVKILVIAEHDNAQLKSATLNCIGAANKIADNFSSKEIVLLIAGDHCKSLAEHSQRLPAISKVWLLEGKPLEYGLAENLANSLKEITREFDYILAPATTFGKNVLPRLAALLEVGQISDVIQILSQDTFLRPMYAGNVLATVQSLDPIKLMTIRTTAFEPIGTNIPESSSANHASPPANETMKPKVPLEIPTKSIVDAQISNFNKIEASKSARPELTSAHVVISGGRGLQNAQNFKLLEDIADKLQAAVGASRAAVDAGFVPNDYQIGQTGKIVAPDLYIAVGISGAIQHLAGMKDSKVIVAINKDPDAPIFQVADYGLVGDLFQILPELNRELADLKK